MSNLCVFLKPQVTTAEGRDRQRDDIETFIHPAIVEAGLVVIDNKIDGLEVSDVSDELIQKICQADVLIIDANCYETAGVFRLSPYLYYYMAFGHSCGNTTILATNTTAHLSHNLITYHTLTYSVKEFRRFIDKFKAAVEGIRQRQNSRPDNPIQVYREQEDHAKTRQRMAEMEAEKAQQKQGKSSSRITFRRVDEETEE